MKLGFVGTGTITEAVVTGLMKARSDIEEIVVSPRNPEIAGRLAARYPVVRIGADNQAVVGGSEIVFLAVRPQIATEVIEPLQFRAGQHVVSFIAVTQIETLRTWIKIPVEISRAIPLPFVADLQGATAIYPPDEKIADLFSSLGVAVQTNEIRQYDLLGAASALMGTYFGLLEASARWLEAEGMPYDQAGLYLKQLFSGLSQAALASGAASFEEMRAEFSTKGGLNEQVFTEFVANGGTDALAAALRSVFLRIRG
ncbi:pyrroline-5-carboxylate reductase [Rhizobium mayense]|uniref:Pyrroline-5-carboxylate reductase n=1 Tax=Rhizobium mayense TaxID=1312184 RepID=A0ABT7K4W2_9HYPH|nr:pyrroline-5-carboxylate reductase [Rhizobium mayense]MDL2403642.1 pyrroline-5-carboxylate reductase [Rhizobium mayense]